MKNRMRLALVGLWVIVCLLAAPAAYAQALGYVSVTAANLRDSSGNKISNATVRWAPASATGQPISFRVGGSANTGQTVSTAATAAVSNGAFTMTVADTALTSPANVCYDVTVTDNSTGRGLLPTGYTCVQPAGSGTAVTGSNAWCTAATGSNGGTCNFDTYVPNLAPLALVQTGPTGPQGPPGTAVNAGTVTYTTSTTASSADNGKQVIMSCAAACAYTLSTHPSTTWKTSVISTGATLATIGLTGTTYNGVATAPTLNSQGAITISANSAVATDYTGTAGVVPVTGGKVIGPVTVGASSSLASNPTITGECPFPVSSNEFCVRASPYHASGFVVYDKTTAGVSAGSTSIAVNNGAQFSVNQVIWIALAGVSGAHYSGNVTTISGNTLTVSPATSSAVPSGIQVWSLGSTTTQGTTAPGTSVIVGNSASYSVGQGILITGAGAASANYLGSITGVSANTLTITPATLTSVSAGTNVQHDDTAAIQAAITAAGSLNSATVFIPIGFYQINGPLQNPSGENAALILPEILYFPTADYWWPMNSLTIRGESPAPTSEGYISNVSIPHVAGTILETSGTSGSLIAGYNASSLANMTNLHFTVSDITFRSPDNPGITMLNGGTVSEADFERINCDTLVAGIPSQPTNSNGRCIVFPNQLNSGLVKGDFLNSIGYYTAFTISEHTVLGNIQGFANWQMLDVAGSGYSDYVSSMNSQGNTYGLVVDPAATGPQIEISRYQIEHQTTAAWMTAVADVYDPNNILMGSAQIDAFPVILTSGASYFKMKRITGDVNGGDGFQSTAWAFGLIGYGSLNNYLTYASTFTNAAWNTNTGTLTVTPNASGAPDGSNTASKLVESTANVTHEIYQGYASGVFQVTCSAYFKPAERSYIRFRFDTGTGLGTIFNLSGSGSIVGSAPSGYSSTIRGFNGWYRVSTTTSTTNATWYEVADVCQTQSCSPYTGDGVSGLYMWGAQCNLGSTEGALVNTTSTAISGRIGFTAPNISW